MKKHIAAGIVLAAAGIFIAGQASAFIIGKRTMFDIPRPPDSYQGQWYVTPQGCSYSRAQAPGYRPTWHLILNPHHIGQPNAPRGCPAML